MFATEKRNPRLAIIHDNLADMRQVLNRLVYQKGGWTLHMLRGRLGTETFWAGIRDYYRRYRDGNVSTDDFRRVMEEASGQDLGWFFQQWLKRPGSPEVNGTWQYRPDGPSHRHRADPGPARRPLSASHRDRHLCRGLGRAADREDRADRATAALRTQGRQGARLGRPRPELLGLDEVDLRPRPAGTGEPPQPSRSARLDEAAVRAGAITATGRSPAYRNRGSSMRRQIASAILAPPVADGSISLA